MQSGRPVGGHWGARALLLAMAGAFCGIGLEAVAEAHGALKHQAGGPSTPIEALAQPAAQKPQEVLAMVWTGADVDGDGQPDFANPTGGDVRGCDDFGCGGFGAERDAGARRHEGADFDAQPRQLVDAPISGFVSRIGYAYPGDPRYRFVEIENPALHYETRVFYIDPSVREGEAVHIGQPIGRDHSLEARYPGITNHVHVEIERIGGRHLDPARFITQQMEEVPATEVAQAGAPRPQG